MTMKAIVNIPANTTAIRLFTTTYDTHQVICEPSDHVAYEDTNKRKAQTVRDFLIDQSKQTWR